MMRSLFLVYLYAAVAGGRPASSSSTSVPRQEADNRIKSTPLEIIIKKRDGLELTDEEVRDFVTGFTSGEIPDYQCASFLMAVNCRGMTDQESAVLTQAMTASGSIADLSDIPGPKVDKHSTGGVGDKTSLILAPIVASLGGVVPMMSGRGLGHTGGTLDKLESIPAYQVGLSMTDFKDVLRKTGAAIISTTADMAPADKKMYAMRDVTGTVPSIPLIIGSIMCKKLAENPDSLVLDVKTGTGAFMSQVDQAITLAKGMIAAGEHEGKPTTAFITTMDQPLGNAAGNWLEIVEVLRTLRGEGPKDLEDVSVELAAQMLVQAHAGGGGRPEKGFGTRAEAASLARAQLRNGKAFAAFRAMVAAQGGDARVLDDPRSSPFGPETLDGKDGRGELRIVQGVYGSAQSAAAPLADVEKATSPGTASHAPFWGPPCHGLEGCRSLEAFFAYSSDGGDGSLADGSEKTLHVVSRSRKGSHGPVVGCVTSLDALAVGNANVLIGAGRQFVGEQLSMGSGVLLHKKVGDPLREGDLLFTLFAEVGGQPSDESKKRTISDADIDVACSRLMAAYKFGPPADVAPTPLMQYFIDRDLTVTSLMEE